MNFIKKVFDGKPDHSVHLQFQKFSRGEFRDRAIVKAKKTGKGFTIWTTAEFANELVRDVAEKLGSKKARVTGGIISTVNLKEIPKYNTLLANATVKQFQGVKNYQVDLELSGNEIIEIVNAFPKAFFALSFSSDDSDLKIKPKAPKSAKPKNKDEAPSPDFCKISTSDEELAKSFVFEKPDFKEAEINHTFMIEQIVVPNELKNEKDFAVIREKSLRKGKLIRKTVIDGKEMITEKAFEA